MTNEAAVRGALRPAFLTHHFVQVTEKEYIASRDRHRAGELDIGILNDPVARKSRIGKRNSGRSHSGGFQNEVVHRQFAQTCRFRSSVDCLAQHA